jgi:selenocysteine lyase/cysteine desulfurase
MREVLNVPATVRASFGIYNEHEDVDKLIEGITNVIKKFR